MNRTILAIGLLVGIDCHGSAQTPPEAAPPAFRPGLGDLMTMMVQPRHGKLGIAGREKNWAYAAYELGELQEAFDRTARVRPRYRDFAVAETMQAVTTGPMAALTEAIRNADEAHFAEAYGQLTEACNSCHRSAGREMIVIQVPRESAYPDQDFRPGGR